MSAPEGWFKLITARGRKVIAFACPTCGLFTRFHFGPARPVRHCGRTEKPRLFSVFIPERILGSSDSNYVKVGTWAAGPFEFEFEEV